MCTLSWTPSADGYRVFFNRDERITRAPGRPPERATQSGVLVLAPTDGDFGGTWIGVNELGAGACLLNRYEDTPVDPPPPIGRISRGLLLRGLLDARSADDLMNRLDALDLAPYQPFTIASFSPGGPVRLGDWNGQDLTSSVVSRPGLIRTSSGRDQLEAERIRGGVAAATLPARATIDQALLRAFHRSHRPERGPFSVCMHREEAATQSLTEIHVTRSTRSMRYWAGPPCTTRDIVVRRIPARPGA